MRVCKNRTCFSPKACDGWGYCRQHNIDAGGMVNVTPEMQAGWKDEARTSFAKTATR